MTDARKRNSVGHQARTLRRETVTTAVRRRANRAWTGPHGRIQPIRCPALVGVRLISGKKPVGGGAAGAGYAHVSRSGRGSPPRAGHRSAAGRSRSGSVLRPCRPSSPSLRALVEHGAFPLDRVAVTEVVDPERAEALYQLRPPA